MDAHQQPRVKRAKLECGLKVWLGFIKLDEKFPSEKALQTLLYNSANGSAEGCDVIALSLTDLTITKETVPRLRHLLQKTLRNAHQYVVNEDDNSLLFRHIPAQLVKTLENGTSRYCSLHIAVRKEHIPPDVPHTEFDHHDCFPVPVQMACKSSRRNEFSPTFKSVLVQEVQLNVQGCPTSLMLLGANLDTNDVAKLGQIEALERLIHHEHCTKAREHPFVALIWGDFNNRLVAYDGMEQKHWKQHSKGKDAGQYELTEEGAVMLAEQCADNTKRRELLSKDSMIYDGLDIRGNKFIMPRCNIKMKQLFHLCTDTNPDELSVPMPSYKQTPLDKKLSSSLGVNLQLTDCICLSQLTAHQMPNDQLDWSYFGWKDAQGTWLQRQIRAEPADGLKLNCTSPREDEEEAPPTTEDKETNLYLQFGWLDGVGISKESTAQSSKIVVWETEDQVQAFDHLPLRAIIEIKL